MFKKYNRLFTFGCSFTEYPWPTWANILAYELNIPFYNYGRSGAGNQFIANTVMQSDSHFQFTENDLIVICWTNVCREDKWVNNRWITPGNIYSQETYDSSYVNQFADPEGYLIRDTATIAMIKSFLDSKNCDYHLLSMGDIFKWCSQYASNETRDLHTTLYNMYKPTLSMIKPSYYEILWNDDIKLLKKEYYDIFGNAFIDFHPLPCHHLTYLMKIFDQHSFSDRTKLKVATTNTELLALLKNSKTKRIDDELNALLRSSIRINKSEHIHII